MGRPRQPHPPPMVRIPEALAKRWIWIFSGIVFLAVVVLDRVQAPAPEGFDVHLFARINAVINSTVSVLLIAGLFTAKAGNWTAHRGVMLAAIALSVFFLASYVLHHLFAGSTPYGGRGPMKLAYYVVLFTHVILAATSLPFILLTAYRSLSADYPRHRRLAKRVWPVWLYVSVSGVVVFWMISPYY